MLTFADAYPGPPPPPAAFFPEEQDLPPPPIDDTYDVPSYPAKIVPPVDYNQSYGNDSLQVLFKGELFLQAFVPGLLSSSFP